MHDGRPCATVYTKADVHDDRNIYDGCTPLWGIHNCPVVHRGRPKQRQMYTIRAMCDSSASWAVCMRAICLGWSQRKAAVATDSRRRLRSTSIHKSTSGSGVPLFCEIRDWHSRKKKSIVPLYVKASFIVSLLEERVREKKIQTDRERRGRGEGRLALNISNRFKDTLALSFIS